MPPLFSNCCCEEAGKVGEGECALASQFSIDKTEPVLFYYVFATLSHC